MTEPETSDEADATVTDLAAELDIELQSRLWLKALLPILQLRSTETEPSGSLTARPQFAFDRMYIAACERAARILRSDLSALDVDGS